MSEYTATITWDRHGAVFTDNRYSRAHTWQFDGGVTVHTELSAAGTVHFVLDVSGYYR